MSSLAEFKRGIREEERRARRAGLAFAEACQSGDVERVLEAANAVNDDPLAWPYAFRALKVRVSPEIAQAFLMVWVEHKSIARHFSRRTDVLRGLRLLFPAYKGGSVRLYRGEFARRHRNRSWGISWTSELNIAENFATDTRQYEPGGSLIVEAVAPVGAILAELDQHYDEREFLVDPRRLDRVRVVRRFERLEMPTWSLSPAAK